jgi:hypothetical protein
MRSSWQWETGHVACRWSELGQRVQYTPVGFQRMHTCRALTCCLFRISPATVPSAEPRGSNPISLIAIPNNAAAQVTYKSEAERTAPLAPIPGRPVLFQEPTQNPAISIHPIRYTGNRSNQTRKPRLTTWLFHVHKSFRKKN